MHVCKKELAAVPVVYYNIPVVENYLSILKVFQHCISIITNECTWCHDALNASQEHVCFRLDGKHVVFGEVSSGMDVVRTIERLGSKNGKTKRKVVIADCGEL